MNKPPSAVRLFVNTGVTVTAEAGITNVAVLPVYQPPFTGILMLFSSVTITSARTYPLSSVDLIVTVSPQAASLRRTLAAL